VKRRRYLTLYKIIIQEVIGIILGTLYIFMIPLLLSLCITAVGTLMFWGILGNRLLDWFSFVSLRVFLIVGVAVFLGIFPGIGWAQSSRLERILGCIASGNTESFKFTMPSLSPVVVIAITLVGGFGLFYLLMGPLKFATLLFFVGLTFTTMVLTIIGIVIAVMLYKKYR